VAEDRRLDLAGVDPGLAVAGARIIGEEFAAHVGKDLPVGGESVDVALGNAALEVRFDVLQSLAEVESM